MHPVWPFSGAAFAVLTMATLCAGGIALASEPVPMMPDLR